MEMTHCIIEIHFQIIHVAFVFLPLCDSECDCARMSKGRIACIVLKFPKLNILFSAACFQAIDDIRGACTIKGNVPVVGQVKRVDHGDVFEA